jgi:hypothetical protein
VVAHVPIESLIVTLLKSIDEISMLVRHLKQPLSVRRCADVEEGSNTWLYRLPDLDGVHLVRPRHHEFMKGYVYLGNRADICTLRRFDHPDYIGLHLLVRGGIHERACVAESTYLEHYANRHENLDNGLPRHLRHDRAPIRKGDGETFLLQLAQSLSDWTAADLHLLGEIFLDQPLPGLEFAGDYCFAQRLGHLVAQRPGLARPGTRKLLSSRFLTDHWSPSDA